MWLIFDERHIKLKSYALTRMQKLRNYFGNNKNKFSILPKVQCQCWFRCIMNYCRNTIFKKLEIVIYLFLNLLFYAFSLNLQCFKGYKNQFSLQNFSVSKSFQQTIEPNTKKMEKIGNIHILGIKLMYWNKPFIYSDLKILFINSCEKCSCLMVSKYF